MSVLFCDADCELWYEKAYELGLKLIKMPYTVDGIESMYDLGEHTDFDAFFSKMRDGSTPITSGLNEEIYTEIFEPYFASGEEILYIAFSSKMSGTFKYLDAAIATLSQKYPKARYRRFDTKNISMGAGLLVYMAAKFHNANGGDIDKTYDYLESIVDHVTVLFVVDDLKYLARGGRMSQGKATVGNIMQIKPVLTIENGEIGVCAKQNGSKKAISYAINEIKTKYKNIDNAPIVVVYAACKETADGVVAKIKECQPDVEIWTQPVGPVIGSHCGPGTCGLIFTS